MITLSLTNGNETLTCKAGADEFTIHVRPYSYADRLTEQGISAQYAFEGASKAREKQVEFLLGMVTGWDGVNTEDGPLPFTQENFRAALAASRSFCDAVVSALYAYSRGQHMTEAAEKKSDPSPGTDTVESTATTPAGN